MKIILLIMILPLLALAEKKEKNTQEKLIIKKTEVFLRTLFFGKGSCKKVIRETLAVKLGFDLYAPVSSRQAREFCLNRSKLIKRFGSVKTFKILGVKFMGSDKAYVHVKLFHPHPTAISEVQHFFVKLKNKWYLVF